MENKLIANWLEGRTIKYTNFPAKYMKSRSKLHWNIFTSAQYFPIKRVVGLSVLMRAWLQRYANQHSAIYIFLVSAYEVVDVNGWNAFPYVHFKSKWHVDL